MQQFVLSERENLKCENKQQKSWNHVKLMLHRLDDFGLDFLLQFVNMFKCIKISSLLSASHSLVLYVTNPFAKFSRFVKIH